MEKKQPFDVKDGYPIDRDSNCDECISKVRNIPDDPDMVECRSIKHARDIDSTLGTTRYREEFKESGSIEVTRPNLTIGWCDFFKPRKGKDWKKAHAPKNPAAPAIPRKKTEAEREMFSASGED